MEDGKRETEDGRLIKNILTQKIPKGSQCDKNLTSNIIEIGGEEVWN